MLTQMRGRLWCLSWRSWVTWATIRTLSTYWEPAPMEVSRHPPWALLLRELRMSLKGVSQPVWMRNPHHVRVCFPRRALTRSLSSSGPVLVITEYCSLGDLLNFLRQKAETFVNLVMNIPEIMENSNDYKNICNQKWYIRRYVKAAQSDVSISANARLFISLFFSPCSDSGISSTSSSTYLEMRPSQQSHIEAPGRSQPSAEQYWWEVFVSQLPTL